MKKILLIALLIMGMLALYTQVALAATSDSLNVSVQINEGTSFVNVPQAAVNFTAFTPDEGDHRTHAGPFTVDYFAASGPWGIRLYTANAGGVSGLIGETEPDQLLLRCWNANKGTGVPGTGTPPDPENDTNWNHPTLGVWSYVPDAGEANMYLCQTNEELDPLFANYLAIDAQGMRAQTYSTSSLTVEIILLP